MYDWSEVAYLFDSGEIPDELAAITDPIEYNYLLVRLRKEFNEKHKSNYLKYMNLNLPYHSRRDEVGGAITDKDWSSFVNRLDGIINKVKKKRRIIIKRRKKRGKKVFPRKTLFKPEKKVNVTKDPLWNEIFIDSNKPGESDSDSDEEEMLEMYKEVCRQKGIKLNLENLMGGKRQTASAKVELANREKEEDISFPPIKFPSMHPKEKPHGSYLEELAFEKRTRRQKKKEDKH